MFYFFQGALGPAGDTGAPGVAGQTVSDLTEYSPKISYMCSDRYDMLCTSLQNIVHLIVFLKYNLQYKIWKNFAMNFTPLLISVIVLGQGPPGPAGEEGTLGKKGDQVCDKIT